MSGARANVLLVLLLAGCGPGGDKPDVPLAELAAITAPLTGDASIPFTLSDRQSRLVNVSFFFGSVPSPSQPATAATASEETRGLSTSPSGLNHTFVWNTVADVHFERLEPVYLRLHVAAGRTEGIGDELGPLVVDNSNLTPTHRVAGRICRSASPLGTKTGDLVGKLYLGLFSDLSYPPMSASVQSADLGTQDFSTAGACVPYQLTGVPPGDYQIISILDDNDNNVGLGGFAIDAGDMTNLGGTRVQVLETDVAIELTLNYFYTP